MAKNQKKTKIDKYIDSLHRIDGKTVIVTGANSGIGFEIAKIALLKGAKVVMACRSLERAKSAKEKLINETGNNEITIEQYDQSNAQSIKEFSLLIKNKYSDFHALILNAGIFSSVVKTDEYRISQVYKTNFVGAYILLESLKELLNDSEQEKRIIIQGSVASFSYKYKNKDRLVYGEEKQMKEYSLSKLCISNLYVHYRDNNLNPYVKYLLCEPGAAPTNLFRDMKKWVKKITVDFLKHFCCSTQEGSLSACKLMCDIVFNGDYYHPGGFFTIKGLPKRGVFPQKYINEKIILDGEEIAKIYVK